MQQDWRPRKSLGQNFLIDGNIARKIVKETEIAPDETILEIGPGQGALTALLCEQAKNVIAIEIDPEMVRVLRERVTASNLTIIEKDVLTVDFAALARKHGVKTWHIVANLPYVISSRLLMRLVEQARAIGRATVMVQHEVADRLLSGPGSRQYGLLSVLLQATGTLTKGFRVSPESFRPQPRVNSMVFTWDADVPEDLNVPSLIATTKAAFNQRRKHLANALTRLEGFHQVELQIACIDSGIEPTTRAEQLSPEDFIRLSATLAGMQETKTRPKS